MDKVGIVIPERASSDVEVCLVKLTELLHKKLGLPTSCGLGGRFGYGVTYENDIFMMHPYCWCNEDGCPWCGAQSKPNFIYKPTGTAIWWYKWIGRSQTQSGKLPTNWFVKCKRSIK